MSIANRSFRLPPDIAAAIEAFADYEDVSQNQWVVGALASVIFQRRKDQDYMTGLAKHFAGKLEQLEP